MKRYCVIKDTIKIIDGSENSTETMMVEAQSAGFPEAEVEILTEEEYQARKALEPIPPILPTAEERLIELELITADLLAEKLGV